MWKYVKRTSAIIAFCVMFSISVLAQAAGSNLLVLQSDFGVKDGAVSAMKGVAVGVDANLKIFDLTHEIPAFDIWEGSYRLMQTASYWPEGTVFVSVVDPGVGSERKSVVVKTKNNQYFVTPDNGTMTLLEDTIGIKEVREIDEKLNRLSGSQESYTFHGRDVYAYTGARLASGVISFEQVGPIMKQKLVRIAYQEPVVRNGAIWGNIPVLDIRYGNVWSNIDKALLDKINVKQGDTLAVKMYHKNALVYEGKVPYVASFSDVPEGTPLAYNNSLLKLSIALNMGDFAATYKIGSGSDWKIKIEKMKDK